MSKVNQVKNQIRKNGKLNDKTKAGLTIIFISVICMIVAISTGGIWLLNNDYSGNIGNNSDINSDGKYATIENVVNEDALFDSLYYSSVDMISNSVGIGTNWLSICGNITQNINGKLFYKVCDTDYKSRNDIVLYLRKKFSNELSNKLVDDHYTDYKGELYVIPYSKNRNNEYFEMDSYEVESKTDEKIEYTVISKYGEDKFITNKFVIEKVSNRWVVSNLEMTY